ncbi:MULTISPECIES: polysaccharide deacetylase family protein [Rheinheimera]|uniref:Polysaccharide deacetylase family protein n=1 Tax=Rheinheimera marina TaxID=1774958 RepID=A0ABV9JPD3_9GAMM
MKHYVVAVLLSSLLLACTEPEPEFHWPAGAKAAVSLSYDDALLSQLQHAVPALNNAGIKASFYLPTRFPVFQQHLSEWQRLAAQGHELGNHTASHPCQAQGRPWVTPEQDLNRRTVAQMQQELQEAHQALKALDGQPQRTFTPPCFDSQAKDGHYWAQLPEFLLAAKTNQIAQWTSQNGARVPNLFLVVEQQGLADILAFLQQAAEQGAVANLLFHGVGGDHMAVSVATHQAILDYLNEHKSIYWTDTYLHIQQYLQQGRLPAAVPAG